MDFKTEKPIYQQIVEYICDHIAGGRWAEQERIPSVRDLAAQLQVNPNTAMRAFERLQAADIITNQRGIGYFVSPGAKAQVLSLKRTEFFETTLPEVFSAMDTLNVTIEEVIDTYRKR